MTSHLMKFGLVYLAAIVLASPLAANGAAEGSVDAVNSRIILATTTSTDNSGLLGLILPAFTSETGVAVDVVAVGTGAALALGENGDADVLLVHAPAREIAFVDSGYGVNRRSVMHNDFVIIGPRNDPAGVGSAADAVAALEAIADSGSMFISRGDDSGTHTKERALWSEGGIEPGGDWYSEAGQGMGAVLTIASETQGYTLADRGTWLSMKDKLDLKIVLEGDTRLYNPYGVIAVNPAVHGHVKYLESMLLIGWLTSPEGQKLIDDYRVNGEVLFFADAVPGR